MAYSIDMRERALTFIEKGNSITETMKVFNIARTTINRWLDKQKKGESLKDPPPKRPWKKIDPKQLQELVRLHPDWTLAEFGEIMGVSANSIWNAFERLKITRKKSPYATKSGTKQSVQHFYSQSKKYHPQI